MDSNAKPYVWTDQKPAKATLFATFPISISSSTALATPASTFTITPPDPDLEVSWHLTRRRIRLRSSLPNDLRNRCHTRRGPLTTALTTSRSRSQTLVYRDCQSVRNSFLGRSYPVAMLAVRDLAGTMKPSRCWMDGNAMPPAVLLLLSLA